MLARAVAVSVAAVAAVTVAGAPAIADETATCPQVTGVSVAYAQVGQPVELTGCGLTGATVAFNGVTAAPSSETDTTVDVAVPDGAMTGPLTVASSAGQLYDGAFTVQLPTVADISRSATAVTYPGGVAVTGTLHAGTAPVQGQSARLQRQVAGGSWHTVAPTMTTAADGTATWTVHPRQATGYRVVFAETPDYGPTTTATVGVGVRPRLVLHTPAVEPILTRFTLTGTAHPATSGGVRLERLKADGWHHVDSVGIGPRGGFTFHLRLTDKGRHTYRVLRAGGSRLLAATSSRGSLTAVDRTLRSGMTGRDVTALQRRLRALHYDLGGITGSYDFDTQHAVVSFEKVQGMTRDGVVGPSVWQRLASPRIPHLLHPIAGSPAVEVDLTRQVVYYAVDGHIARILDSSTGGGYTYTGSDGTQQQAITPEGHFQVVYKVDRWVHAKLGYLYRPAYFNNDGYAIHGETEVPSYPASHGCVRITVPAMDRMYAKLYPGISVWIYRS